MSDITSLLSLGSGNSLARERLIWATRPMGFLFLVLWILHPSTASHTDYVHMSLVGFLAGLFYGCVVYGKKLREYIVDSNRSQRHRKNRVPEEYYWGNVTQVMFINK